MAEGTQHIASNRKARHDYFIESTVEAGMVLQGSEVKSLREGRADMTDAFCQIDGGEAFLLNLHIAPYGNAGYQQHEPQRRRKLLLRKREISKLRKATTQKGYTLVPLRLYFRNGYAKAEIAVAQGKKQYDKRESIAKRDAERRMQQLDTARRR